MIAGRFDMIDPRQALANRDGRQYGSIRPSAN